MVAEEDAQGARPTLRWWGFGNLAPLTLFIALALVVVAGGVGYGLAAGRQATYVAYASTLLDQPDAIAASQDAGVVDKLSRLRLKYAGLVHSDAVQAQAAITVDATRDDVQGRAIARLDPNSLLLQIGAAEPTQAKAVKLANALASALAGYVDREQAGARIAPTDRVTLEVVQPARSAVKALPTTRTKLTSAVGTALVAFVLVAAVLDVMRRRAR